jgi:NAD(P)-dependent dehydrogenase (short-subunit alcohol dehydrogenase family)
VKKVLLTGGADVIGRRLAVGLIRHGDCAFTAFDNQSLVTAATVGAANRGATE